MTNDDLVVNNGLSLCGDSSLMVGHCVGSRILPFLVLSLTPSTNWHKRQLSRPASQQILVDLATHFIFFLWRA
jgi:hypothetical protein